MGASIGKLTIGAFGLNGHPQLVPTISCQVYVALIHASVMFAFANVNVVQYTKGQQMACQAIFR